jgi:hypothetical protein
LKPYGLHPSERNLPFWKTMVSLLLDCFPFSPDWVMNVFPSRRLKAGTVLGDAAAPTTPGIASAPVAVTEIRAIAMAANEMVERGATIFGFSVREKHPCY